MNFESKKEALDWFERQPRSLTPEFIANINWNEVRNHPLSPGLVPILLYMRDVEVLTEMYHRELLRTPTGRDRYISKFMERWGVEEITHGEVLNRFLNESGYESTSRWKDQVARSVSAYYRANTYLITTLTKLVGRKFTATHMTYGAINEMSATQAYRRLMKIANHPVLTEILTAIIREESAHTKFYTSVARLELERSGFARRVARSLVDRFWLPVGSGARPKEQTNYAIGTLFQGSEGIEIIDRSVTQRVRGFPGFAEFTRVTERIGEVALTQTA